MRISDWSSDLGSSDLLDNAVRFTAPSRKSGARVLLHADGDARGIDIIVSDNGPGMPEAAAAVAKGQRAGTATGGIGLALARQLVAAHGGAMEVVSEEGQGTRSEEHPTELQSLMRHSYAD